MGLFALLSTKTNTSKETIWADFLKKIIRFLFNLNQLEIWRLLPCILTSIILDLSLSTASRRFTNYVNVSVSKSPLN